jgi:iron complex transport system ATP-binding protein
MEARVTDAVALSVRDVRVSFDRPVLDGVSLEVAHGSWVNVVGPNGAGKSTLLRVLAGLAAHEGEVHVAGHALQRLRRRELARLVALVPQVPQIPAGMTVSQYVLLGRTPHLRPLGAEGTSDLAAARDALERLELLPFAERVVATLSGGELQRVLVARLLAQDPVIALLDEPTSALDVGHQQQVLDLVDELRREHGLTVVATMHDLTLAAQYGDSLALLHGGRIVADGVAADVLKEETLNRIYGARVRVIDGDDGPIVVPVR